MEAGITGNPNDPNDHQNFGRVFDDRANEPMLNQATLTVERALVPEPGKFDWGFKLQAGVGSDGRFINTLGTLENVNRGIIMPYVVEAYGNLHAPLSFLNKDAGVDVRFGQFVTLLGAETIDPRTNYFYSHDYIFNFGIPLQHLGVLSTIHFNPTFDLYAGITRGANTSIYDNNGYAAFLGGFGLNNLRRRQADPPGHDLHRAGEPARVQRASAFNGSGVRASQRLCATTATWSPPTRSPISSRASPRASTPTTTASTRASTAERKRWPTRSTTRSRLSARFEAVRDSEGFYVAQFGQNDDFTNLERGVAPLDKRTVGGGPNTYLESTVGVQIKPLKYLTVRPEVRFDHSTERHPFDDSSKQYSVTVGADAIIAF